MRVVDVRLNNVSQLAGFAKKDDLQFFLREICQMGYVHLPILAPTAEMLDTSKKKKGEWSAYERDFLALMRSRDSTFRSRRISCRRSAYGRFSTRSPLEPAGTAISESALTTSSST